jgi:mannose-6-phosphate isomerase
LGAAPGERYPEDWIGSVTTVMGRDDAGLSRLSDGTRLRDAVESDPISYLGPEHVSTLGSNTGLLVKVIDAQQRLSIHIHPDRPFARRHMRSPFGKTEAWYVLEAADDDAAVYFGFTETIDADALLATVGSGRGASLLERMNRVPVKRGDAVFVPAGTPHAIGEGILLVEVQEPSDLLVRLEWGGYAVGDMRNDLGLGFATALSAVDRSAWDAARLDDIRGHVSAQHGLVSLVPGGASAFFRLESAVVETQLTLPQMFGIVIAVAGSGTLRSGATELSLRTGDAVLVPWSAGEVDLAGDPSVVVCRPPDPSQVVRADPDLTAWLRPADPADITH